VGARLAAGLLLAVWLTGGLLLTLLPPSPPPALVEHNFIPFRTIGIYLANLDSGYWVGQSVGNLLLLLLVGVLGPVVFPWLDRWLRVLVAALVLSAGIELAQLWVPDRSADVDDVLLNVVGALIGYAILRIVRLGSGRVTPSSNATDPRPPPRASTSHR